MTTIAYKDGIMACDTRITSGSKIMMGEVVKCFYTDGALVGTCGDADEQFLASPLFKKLKTPDQLGAWLSELEVDDRDWGLLIVFFNRPKDVYIADIASEGDSSKSGYYSVKLSRGEGIARGSGNHFAEAGMKLGLSAAESVEFAMDFDAATGGSVYEYPVDG